MSMTHPHWRPTRDLIVVYYSRARDASDLLQDMVYAAYCRFRWYRGSYRVDRQSLVEPRRSE
jgi:hypothetical protein